MSDAEKHGLYGGGAVDAVLGFGLERGKQAADADDQLEQLARVEERPGDVRAFWVVDEDHLKSQEGLDHVLEVAVLVILLERVGDCPARGGRVEAHAEDALDVAWGSTAESLGEYGEESRGDVGGALSRAGP